MRYTAAARRAELQFSARAFTITACIALILAITGWARMHDAGILGLHLLIATWCARQAHADQRLARTLATRQGAR